MTGKRLPALALTVFAAFPLLGQPDWTAVSRAVVKIEAGKDAGKETGTGVVISQSAQAVRILTAKHVVAKAGLRVFFYSDQAVAYNATAFSAGSDDLDLALIEVRAAPGRALPANILAIGDGGRGPLRLGEHIFILGNGWQLAEASVSLLNHERDTRMFEYRPKITDGFSGSPIFDSTARLVGIHNGALAGGESAVATKEESASAFLSTLGYSLQKTDTGRAAAKAPAVIAPPKAAPAPSQPRGPVRVSLGGGSSLTYDSGFWARGDADPDTINLFHPFTQLEASFRLDDFQTPIESLKATMTERLRRAGPKAVIEDQRVVSIQGQNFTALRISQGTTVYLIYFYSGPLGTLQASVFGEASTMADWKSEIAELVGGIALARR